MPAHTAGARRRPIKTPAKYSVSNGAMRIGWAQHWFAFIFSQTGTNKG
jgi:hypothetical protein